jgi:phosphopantothenoylcysteine decarboxylase/phosphopantothenate--cysteine ligase
MSGDDNSVTLLDKNGAHPLARASKTEVAKQLLQHMVKML